MANVVQLEATLVEDGGDGHGRTNPHDLGWDTLNGVAPPDAQNCKTLSLCLYPGHEEDSRGPVCGLGGISRRGDPVPKRSSGFLVQILQTIFQLLLLGSHGLGRDIEARWGSVINSIGNNQLQPNNML